MLFFFPCYVFADKMPVEKRDSIISEKKISPNGQGLYFPFQPEKAKTRKSFLGYKREVDGNPKWKWTNIHFLYFLLPLATKKTFHFLAKPLYFFFHSPKNKIIKRFSNFIRLKIVKVSEGHDCFRISKYAVRASFVSWGSKEFKNYVNQLLDYTLKCFECSKYFINSHELSSNQQPKQERFIKLLSPWRN